MTTTLDMNTPEHTIGNNHSNVNKEQYIDKLQAQLVQNQIRRIQGRDYGRILHEYNKPVQWYKTSPITRSIYFYDPNYQKYLQQQSHSSTNVRRIPSPTRVDNQSKPRSKCTVHLHNPSNNHQQKQILASRLQSVPKLPPIMIYKKSNGE